MLFVNIGLLAKADTSVDFLVIIFWVLANLKMLHLSGIESPLRIIHHELIPKVLNSLSFL